MPDRLGIVTRYLQNEVTYAAIQAAETARDHGVPTSILARSVCRREVCGSWDSRVISERGQPFRRWATRCDRIVWTAVPPRHEVAFAKDLGIETGLLVNWEELLPEHQGAASVMDKLLIPYRCVSHVLSRKWRLKGRNILMPWDVPAPICHDKEKRHKRCIFFPLYDSQPQRTDQLVFRLMQQTLENFKDTTILVACGRRWSISSRRMVRGLRKIYGDRAVLVVRPNMLERILLFARSNLTVWPARFESFGLVGLHSLCMGTPVIAWDIRPHNEFLQAWKNSVLVPCKTSENWLGVPEVDEKHAVFEECLLSLLRDRELLAKMEAHTHVGLENRRKQHRAGWAEYLK